MLWLVVLSDCQVEVEEGEESVLLPFKTTPDLPDDTEVKWKLYDPKPTMTVHVYPHGSDRPEEQNQVYRDRTEMKKDLLKTGDFSLTLKNPKHTDTGTYRCIVYNQDGNTVRMKTVQLEVKGQCEDTGQRSVCVFVSGCLSLSNCPLSPLQGDQRWNNQHQDQKQLNWWRINLFDWSISHFLTIYLIWHWIIETMEVKQLMDDGWQHDAVSASIQSLLVTIDICVWCHMLISSVIWTDFWLSGSMKATCSSDPVSSDRGLTLEETLDTNV